MCIEMCIELILELAGFALLLALCDVVLFPSPLQSIYLHLINLPFLLYPIFYIILIQSLQTFRNRRNTSPFCCK
ncbi:hypothetical protein EYY22_24250 [Escherichia coli]|nr:hypothetical protein [Escherichia coli]TIJ00227.1 hypothetical protein EYY22_24250 [Escherichia coli]TIJ64697.1 hypothetical protein EYY00_24610 [Escherichia coli]